MKKHNFVVADAASAQHSSDRNLPPNLTVIEISVESDFNSALVLRLAK